MGEGGAVFTPNRGGIHTEWRAGRGPGGQWVGGDGGVVETCTGRSGAGNDVLWRWYNGGLMGGRSEIAPDRGR